MKSGVSPIIATVLLIAIAVITSVAVWYWVSPFSAKPGLSETGKGYAVVSVYRNSSGNGCTALDVQNKGTSSITNLLMYIRDYNTGKPAGVNGTDPIYPVYVNVTAINRGDTVHFNFSGGQVGTNGFSETNISDMGGSFWATAVDVGDSDNNGLKDVVVGLSRYGEGNNVKMVENRSGNWTEKNISVQSYFISAVAVGDADNDGKDEVFVGTEAQRNESRLYENASGSWVETNLTSWSNGVAAFVVGDADNDSLNESVAGGSGAKIRIYWQNTTGGWSYIDPSGCTAGNTVQSIAIGDANNDGTKDMTYGTYGGVSYELRRCQNNSASWTTTNIADVTADTGINSVAVGDADNDALNEVVIGISRDDNQTRMYKNMSGTWVETNISQVFGVSVGAVAIGDADNDGSNEVVMGTDDLGANGYELRMYEKSGSVWVETNISDTPTDINDLTIADANNDGQKEIVVTLGSTNFELRMYRGIATTSSNSIPLGTYILRTSSPGFSDFIFTCS